MDQTQPRQHQLNSSSLTLKTQRLAIRGVRVPCVKRGGVRFTIYGHDYFNLVLVTNVAGAGSIRSMDVRSSDSTEWMPMARNWGANWHTLAYLSGKMLSFRSTNVVPRGWAFSLTFASNLQFS
uniref:Expansin n=1 Tax=Setaria italica TaxID=4555 RepID=K3YZU5_SETIT